jgi:hypothetical protein
MRRRLQGNFKLELGEIWFEELEQIRLARPRSSGWPLQTRQLNFWLHERR